MYSDAAQGHGSVLIEVLIETASSMHTPTQSLCIFLFPLPASISVWLQPLSSFLSFLLELLSHSNIYMTKRPYLGRLARDAEYLLSQQSEKTERNFSDALII